MTKMIFSCAIGFVASMSLLVVGCALKTTGPITEPELATEYLIGGNSIRLINGISEIQQVSGSASNIVTRDIGYDSLGDVNGDGREDRVFIVNQDSGGTGTFFYVVARLSSNPGYVGSEGYFIGDRITPLNMNMNMKKDGDIEVVFLDRKQGQDYSSAPTLRKSVLLRLNTSSLRFEPISGSFPPSLVQLGSKSWVWVTLSGPTGVKLAPEKADAFTLIFQPDGLFSATTDCNNLRGSYSVDDSQLSFKGIIATRMYCDNSQEDIFIDLLQRVERYHITPQDRLMLKLKAGSVIGEFK